MNKKKAIAIFVAVSTFASNVPVLGANFTDINNVPWEGAKTYINSVADKGIMVGDYNSSGQLVFRSRDGVTYCETMQLVYALIQKTKGTSVTADVQTKWTSVMNGYNIPTWAQPAIAYGLENGIVTISDIPGFVNSSGKSVNATRQNVAIMFGRALKDYGTFNQNATISFKDAASVNAIAVPFIAHLNSLGIISGDDLGNFNPTNSINRAEMAVIVSKAYDTMSTPAVTTGSFSGEVTSVESVGSTTVITVKGDTETKSFSGNSTTAVLRDTNKILISALVVGDKVLVSYKGQDISSVLVTTSASTTTAASEVTGTYVSMSSSNIKISVNGTTKTYTYAGGDYSNVNFYVENASSTYTKFLNAATTNKTIKLVLNSAGDITKAYVESESKGTFVSIATTNIKLKVDSSTKTYYFKNDYDDAEYYINGTKSTSTKFKNTVASGQTVKLTLDSDAYITRVDLTSEVTGTFVSIGTANIKLKVDGTTTTYEFESDYDDATYYIDGTKSTYTNFKNNATTSNTVKLTLDSNSFVTKVDLSKTGVVDYDKKGTYSTMTTNYIRIIKSNGSSETFYYNGYSADGPDRVDFYVDGSSSTYTNFKNKATTSGTVYLVLNSNDEITKAYLVTSSSSSSSSTSTKKGTFYSMTDAYIRVKISGSNETYYYSNSDYGLVSFYVDGSSSTYTKFKNAADTSGTVELVLNSAGEITKAYLVTNTTTYEKTGYFVSINDSYIRIRINSTNTTYYYKNYNDVGYDSVKFYIDGTTSTYRSFSNTAVEDCKVTLVLNSNNEITAAYLTKPVVDKETSYSGGLYSISASGLSISGSNSSKRYYFKSDTSINVIDGDSTLKSVSNLMDAYDNGKLVEIEILVDSNDEILTITGYVSYAGGELIGVNAGYIDMYDGDSSVRYYFTSNCSFYVEDSDYEDSLNGIKDYYDDYYDLAFVAVELNKSGLATSVRVY